MQEMRAIGLKMNGKEMKQKIGMKAIGPMKMKQHGNTKHGMNDKKITTMSMDNSKEKGRKERKDKEKERKVMDHKIKEKDKVRAIQFSHARKPRSHQRRHPEMQNR